MDAGQSVSFLDGQAVQHFQGCQMTVAPYTVADDNHQENGTDNTDPSKQLFQTGQHGLGIDFVVELHERGIGIDSVRSSKSRLSNAQLSSWRCFIQRFSMAVPSGVAILVRMKLSTHSDWKKCLNGMCLAT